MNWQTEYKSEYAIIALQKLAQVPMAKEEALCLVFRCTPSTLNLWKADHEDFAMCIKLGLLAGETRIRESLAKLAVMPTKKINTKLLSILVSNVYDITEEHVNTIVADVTSSGRTAEEILKQRGIPIPDIDIPDVPDVEKVNL